jgi:hypothetical protein
MSDYWKKVVKGLLIAVAGSALTYVSTVVVPGLSELGGPAMLVIVPLVSAAVNALQKALLG